MKNIKIEKEKEIVGSVNWLKEQLENMVFRFSERKGNPSVAYAFLHEPNMEGERMPGDWNSAVLLAESPKIKHKFFEVCEEYNETLVIYPSDNAAHDHGWTMFPYLTPAAQVHCKKLIHMLADELVKKVKSDKGDLKINVTVE
jgi:hypothetical protein